MSLNRFRTSRARVAQGGDHGIHSLGGGKIRSAFRVAAVLWVRAAIHPATARQVGARAALAMLLVGACLGLHATGLGAQTLTSDHLANLTLREIGPATMSGRIVDLAVNERDPWVIYAASATGGVWKTVNNGVVWRPVFHQETSHSVGAIAVHPVDTAVVWVGTGERANRQSSSWGDGVYRSTDGGRTWTNVGLQDSHHIGRIALHPTDADVAYVAAMGHLWGPNEERGLYHTADGGETWRRILAVDTLTGVVDVALDPSDPSVVYAATYQRMRKAYGFDGGGPGSGLWKSTDGGETWRKLGPLQASGNDPAVQTAAWEQGRETQVAASDTMGATGPNGLPIGEYGRIGISIYRSDPRTVYVSVEQGYRFNASTEYTQRLAGLYRSEDRGESWTHMGDWNPRPMYASQPLVDPNDDQRVYMMNNYSWSDDGGRTFTDPPQSLHGDDRILWVNPRDSRHVIKGDDGGVGISYDRGRTWLYVASLPVSQWYRVAVDNAFPFNVYGGLQDNGSWAGPSATFNREGIRNGDWRKIGGGDGFIALPDTVDGRTIYAESQYLGLTRIDRQTWQVTDIRPGDPTGHIGARKNWDAWGPGLPEPELGNAMEPANWDGPYIISPHDPATIYAGTRHLWKSTDRGQSWTSLGDLTTQVDRRELRIAGRRGEDYTASLDDGIPYYPGLTAIAESPLEQGVLYAGTDDGNLSVSRDGGATWTEVTDFIGGGRSVPVADRLRALPEHAWVSGIEASRYARGRVYAVFNNYRNDDYANYLFRSDDYGASWISVVGDLSAERVLRTVREDPRNADVLWLGAEFGLWVSVDAGAHWTELRANMPTLPFNDLAIHPRDNDLVLGSHGRGVWILDNVNAIQEMSAAVVAADAHLFTVEPAYQIRLAGTGAHVGDMVFRGRNPASGALIDYWLRETVSSDDVSLTVHDAGGGLVRELTPRWTAGVNRVTWDLRHESLPGRPSAVQGGGSGRGPAGPLVVPGTYTVRLALGDVVSEQTVEVREDPRVDVSPTVRAQWTADLLEIAELYRELVEQAEELEPLRRRLPLKKESPRQPPGSAGAERALTPPEEPVLSGEEEREVREAVERVDELLSRVGSLYSEVGAVVGAMTADQRARLDWMGGLTLGP